MPDLLAVLPPPPAAGSAQQQADAAKFKALRQLRGTPRWNLAIRDDALSTAALLADFSCAFGAELSAQKSPALFALLDRVNADAQVAVSVPKDHYRRPRPFIGSDLPVCIEPSKGLTKSGSYPSGHSTRGWTFGLILAELAPDRAAPLLARGRAYGESRVVCGVHWESDVEAGWLTASALVATLHSDATFRADLERARAELATARHEAASTASDRCTVEAEAAAHAP